jgi:hypothetical protein
LLEKRSNNFEQNLFYTTTNINMELEYKEDYDTLNIKCPPNHYKSLEIDNVYRWTFEKIEDKRNFQTQYHKKPKRFQEKSDIDKCKALALSMFNDLAGAKIRFEELAEVLGDKVYEILGNRIAKGQIETEYGLNGNIERHGHFNHHPSIGIPAKSTFKILENQIL